MIDLNLSQTSSDFEKI